jgi:hypothetical protein
VRRIFSVYGLRLAADRPIPGLMPHADTGRVDVDIQLISPQAATRESVAGARGVPARRGSGDWGRPEAIALPWNGERGYRILYEDGTDFIMDRRGSRIRASWQEPLTLADAAVYLLGPVLAFVLRLRGITCLHASAFVVDGGAVAIIGPSGAGKSTTSAAFAGRGFPVLCDDTLAIEERHGEVIVHPGYPRLRLWPEAMAILERTRESLPRLTPNWDKRYLDLQDDNFRHAGEPVPLRAIYALEGRRDDGAAPCVESSSASSALLTLLANLRSDFFPDKESHRREFDAIGRLSKRFSPRRVAAGTGPESLTTLCDAIVEDLGSAAQAPMRPSKLKCTI